MYVWKKRPTGFQFFKFQYSTWIKALLPPNSQHIVKHCSCHGVIWFSSSGVTSREDSSEKRAGSQYCGSPAAWVSNHASPSFSRSSWKQWEKKGKAYHTFSMFLKSLVSPKHWVCFWNTYKYMASTFFLPLKVVLDLAYCYITLFLQKKYSFLYKSAKLSMNEWAIVFVFNTVYLSQLKNNSVIHIKLSWNWLD